MSSKAPTRAFPILLRFFFGIFGAALLWYDAACLSAGAIRFLRRGNIVLHRDTEPAMFWLSVVLLAVGAGCTLLLAFRGNIGARRHPAR